MLWRALLLLGPIVMGVAGTVRAEAPPVWIEVERGAGKSPVPDPLVAELDGGPVGLLLQAGPLRVQVPAGDERLLTLKTPSGSHAFTIGLVADGKTVRVQTQRTDVCQAVQIKAAVQQARAAGPSRLVVSFAASGKTAKCDGQDRAMNESGDKHWVRFESVPDKMMVYYPDEGGVPRPWGKTPLKLAVGYSNGQKRQVVFKKPGLPDCVAEFTFGQDQSGPVLKTGEGTQPLLESDNQGNDIPLVSCHAQEGKR